MEKFTLPYKVIKSGDKAIIFIHGFMDGGVIWKSTIEGIDLPGYEMDTLDLPGMAGMNLWRGELGLQALADTVITVVDALNKPCVIVGHSMGCQVGELVAAARPELVQGLVLLTPIPLIGLPCDEATIEAMHTVGGNREMQVGMRKGFSPELPDADIDALVDTGMKCSRESAASLFDAWSQGLPEGKDPSRYTGKVMAIVGTEDPFASPAVVEEGVRPRFKSFEVSILDGASHWPHVTQGAFIGEKITNFVKSL